MVQKISPELSTGSVEMFSLAQAAAAGQPGPGIGGFGAHD